jgi:hypothetical protein
MESLTTTPAMAALLMKKKKTEEAIARQAAIEEVELQIATLQAKKEEMMTGSGKKRGAKPLAEMTPEERTKHDLAVALRREKKAASATSSTTATASGSAAEEEKVKKPRAPMTDEHKAKMKAGREAAAAKKAAEAAEAAGADAAGGGAVEAPKKTHKKWNPWALTMGFKTGDLFSVVYKGNETMLTGLWEDERYFLCSDLIAPCPEGWTAKDALDSGYGVPIKWDAPTGAAALVKYAQGAPMNKKNRGPDACPADVKIRVAGKLISVYA